MCFKQGRIRQHLRPTAVRKKRLAKLTESISLYREWDLTDEGNVLLGYVNPPVQHWLYRHGKPVWGGDKDIV